MDQSMKNGRGTAPSTSRVDPPIYVKKKEGNIEDCAEKNDGKKPDKLHKNRKEQRRKIRVGSWNIGTMTGKGRELVEVMKKRKLEMLCMQETRWGGNSAREIGEGYKIIYSGGTAKGKRNGVGVVLNEKWKEKVMEIDRCSDKLIRVKLVTRDGLLNIISAYSPQTALQNEEKEAFLDNFEQMVRKVPHGEKAIICGDLNAHIGTISEGFKNTHGGFGYGQKNDDGERTLEVAQSLDLVFANTLF